jgi:DNA-binding HxlR family transcriptional regulator
MKAVVTVDGAGRKSVAEPCLEPCPIERGMRLLGGKWKGSILWHLKDGPVRFNDLARQLGGASKKMVNQRLKELETLGLVERHVISDRPIAVQYEITDFGRSALVVLDQMREWAESEGI